ncbi:hypothetical protein MBLNU459_g1558t1 [Dothideomycetes sp. NU459]
MHRCLVRKPARPAPTLASRTVLRQDRCISIVAPPWRPASILDEWVAREARPISLRQLTYFGRVLTESRLLGSANYVRLELPTRIAHRLRNMQTLPYSALINPHISHVYELYYTAFEKLRKVPEVKTLDDNDKLCEVIKGCLTEHLSVIPRLATGVLEIQGSIPGEQCDQLMTTLLRSRISRRVIAEQHLALTETYHSPWHFPQATKSQVAPEDEFVGEVFLKCNAREVVENCAATIRDLARKAYGAEVSIPEVIVQGDLDTAFPYIPSHLEYIIGELLRNSIQAVVERDSSSSPAPIQVLICEAAQHVIIRISDQGGGVDHEVLPLAATLQELQLPESETTGAAGGDSPKGQGDHKGRYDGSLSSLTSRSPDLRLGIGLPMSRVYAEYWAGSLELHNLEGYGVDTFLQISKLGNKNEVLSTRASMDAV